MVNYYSNINNIAYNELKLLYAQHPTDFDKYLNSAELSKNCKDFIQSIINKGINFIQKHKISKKSLIEDFILQGIRIPHNCKRL